MSKIKVGIIFGGESFEHQVSKMTARSIIEHIDRALFDVSEIYIDPNGKFDDDLLNDIDVAFLAVHGPNCEDGKLQQFLENRRIKYTGSGIEASKINMSKSLMHNTFKKAGLPVVKYRAFNKNEFDIIADKAINDFKFPIFIKPDNAGSSVGISKIDNMEELEPAIKEAFKRDNRIVVEQGIENPREIEIGVLGNNDLIISEPGEVLSKGQFYSYENKYLNPFETTTKVIDLHPEQVKVLKQVAVSAYTSTHCRGYARVDFLMDKNNKIFISEINTLPGFTSISMFPKLMETVNITYKDLITKIIYLSLE